MSTLVKSKPARKPVICLPTGVLTQSIRHGKKGERIGMFYAIADESAPMKFSVGWAKCNTRVVKKVKEVMIPADLVNPENVKNGMELVSLPDGNFYVKRLEVRAPLDEFDASEGIKICKSRLTGDIAQVEQDIRNSLVNASDILPTYRFFLSRCLSYFKP